MAKPPSPPPAAEPAPAPAPKRSKKLLVIVIAGVLVVLLLAAAVLGVLLMKKGKGEQAQEESEQAVVASVDLSKPPTFVPLDSFVVNLAPAEGERYLQAVMALRVSDPKTAEHLKGFMPMIRDEINKVLSSKLPSELSTMEGREALASELVSRINGVLGAPVGKNSERNAVPPPIEAVLFNSFIVQ